MKHFSTCDICKNIMIQEKIQQIRLNHKKTKICPDCLKLAESRSSDKKLSAREEIILAIKKGNVRFK